MAEDPDPVVDALGQLHRAGWATGDVVVVGDDGSRRWVVFGSNGENLIEAEGPTAVEAWRSALDQARSLGMLGG